MKFSAEQLLRAMAPIDVVIDAFLEEEKVSQNVDVSQGNFATLIASTKDVGASGIESIPVLNDTESEAIDWDGMVFFPSDKYVQKLVMRYATRLDIAGKELEDDNLASLVCHFAMSRISNIPDLNDCCVLTYQVPVSMQEGDSDLVRLKKNKDLLRIRVYPHHNDVGVAKVWEAGACLAEYILQNPIRDCRVIELGAGVGLTGLVAAAVKAKSVHMTDYTEATLDNLSYNVSINSKWLEGRGVDPKSISVGKLEWGEASTEGDFCLGSADLLIAADVVYAREVIPDLVTTVRKFLSSGSSKVALFATTHRNRQTFELFEQELERKGIICKYTSHSTLGYVFPCYFNQPRSDVRICTMRLSE
jgi:predicted nicotinamide N-methyase